MGSSAITSWQIDGETVETVADSFFGGGGGGGGSKNTADGDFSHEIKRCLLLGRSLSFYLPLSMGTIILVPHRDSLLP